jgi:hypothetical protein
VIDFFAYYTTDGQWLVIVESRKEFNTDRSSTLKFWSRVSGTAQHTLHTIIDPPHYSPIVALTVATTHAVTVAGLQFKVWHLLPPSTAQPQQWQCFFVGSYRELPAQTAEFSGDASLLGVAFGSQVVVWLPQSCQPVRSLPHSQTIVQIAFVATQPHLLTASTRQLTVWNLISFQGNIIYIYILCVWRR